MGNSGERADEAIAQKHRWYKQRRPYFQEGAFTLHLSQIICNTLMESNQNQLNLLYMKEIIFILTYYFIRDKIWLLTKNCRMLNFILM